MAKLTQRDRDLRDAKKVKAKTENLLKLTKSFLEREHLILEQQDNADLTIAKESFERMMERYRHY